MGERELLFTKEDIRFVARDQRIICLIFLCFLIIMVAGFCAGVLQLPESHPIFTIMNVLEICIRIAALIFVYRLASSMKVARPWMYVIGMFFPWINLLVLAFLIPRATKVLRANNIRVGLLGYNKEDLSNYLSGNWERK